MKDRLHILFLTGWYPSRVSLEVGDFIQRHAEAVSLKNKVSVLHVISDENVTNSIEISDSNINNIRTLIAYVKPASSSIIKAIRFLKAYSKLLKRVGSYDVVHLNKLFPVGLVALFLKILRGKKYIISEHFHIYHQPYNKKIGFLEKLVSKTITKNAQYVCPVSSNLGNAMQKFGLKGNYSKVPNVIFTDVFSPKKEEKQKEFTLMHASSMSEVKNIPAILDSLRQLQNHIAKFKFYLIGRDSDKFVEMANTIGIKPENIAFIDQISQDELATYYKKSDVFILFSDIETFSCVIYESFASGTSVIAPNVGGIKEYFPESFGLLIEKGDETALLASMLRIHDNFNKPSSEAMHAYVEENFSPTSISRKFDLLYRKCQ